MRLLRRHVRSPCERQRGQMIVALRLVQTRDNSTALDWAPKISGFYLEFYKKNGLRLGVRTAVARHRDRRAPLAQDVWWNLGKTLNNIVKHVPVKSRELSPERLEYSRKP